MHSNALAGQELPADEPMSLFQPRAMGSSSKLCLVAQRSKRLIGSRLLSNESLYSALIAMTGSAREARRAGARVPTNATSPMVAMTPPITSGSNAFTP